MAERATRIAQSALRIALDQVRKTIDAEARPPAPVGDGVARGNIVFFAERIFFFIGGTATRNKEPPKPVALISFSVMKTNEMIPPEVSKSSNVSCVDRLDAFVPDSGAKHARDREGAGRLSICVVVFGTKPLTG